MIITPLKSAEKCLLCIQMIGPTILPHHAVIANIEGVVTVTPTSEEAECYVEGMRIHETTVLQHGKVVRFGHHHAFRFLDPAVDEVLFSWHYTTLKCCFSGAAYFGKALVLLTSDTCTST